MPISEALRQSPHLSAWVHKIAATGKGRCSTLGTERFLHFFSKKLAFLGPVYTWRTLTGVKLNNNEPSTLGQQFFRQRNQDTEPELY